MRILIFAAGRKRGVRHRFDWFGSFHRTRASKAWQSKSKGARPRPVSVRPLDFSTVARDPTLGTLLAMPKARTAVIGRIISGGLAVMQAARKRAKKRPRHTSGIQVASRKLESGIQVVARKIEFPSRSTMLPPAHETSEENQVEVSRLENVLCWEADPADIHRRPTFRP
jgi:hypothetical protein